MRVTRLEIFGFKSFVDRFVLNFDEDILGIVGPNGCGKSNIVDALRWVLGETHARQLRGTVLEDLIFNGCESRRPLGMAEVSLTLRPDEHWLSVMQQTRPNGEADSPAGAELPEETDEIEPNGDSLVPTSLQDIPGILGAAEVQLTRRLYRSGESEFFINRVACRLRDMTELYRLIGLGSRGLSIVEQGEIGEFIAKRPLERRELLEEAAGISGFRTRIESAQKRLERTADNMARLTDIITEVEKQVRTLRIQARRAKARNELKESLAASEQALFASRAARVLLNKKNHEERDFRFRQVVSQKEEEFLSLQRKEEQRRAALDELDSGLVQARTRRDQLTEHLNEHRAREHELRLELTRVESKLSALLTNQTASVEREALIASDREAHQAAINRLEGELQSIREAHRNAEAALETLVFSASRPEGSSFGAAAEDRATAEARLVEEMRKLSAIREELRSLEKSKTQLLAEREGLTARLREKQLKCAKYEAEIRALESQTAFLAEGRHSNAEGDQDSAQVLAKSIKTPVEYRPALSAILGDRVHFVVSDHAMSLARDFAEGKVTAESDRQARRIGYIFPSARVSPVSALLRADLGAVSPSVRPLLDCVSVDDQASGALCLLLQNVLVVDTLTEALALREALLQQPGSSSSNFLLVTLSGEVVAAWGWYIPEGEALLVALKKRIEDCRSSLADESSAILPLEESIAALNDRVSALDPELTRLREAEQILTAQHRELLGQLEADRRAKDEARRIALETERSAHAEVRKFATGVALLEGQIANEQRRIEDLQREGLELIQRQQRLAEEQQKLASLREDMLARIASDEQSREQQYSGSHDALYDELACLTSSIREQEASRESLRKELAASAALVHAASKELESMQRSQSEIRLDLDRCEVELSLLIEDAQRYQGQQFHLPDEHQTTEILNRAGGDLDAHIHAMNEEAQRLRRRLDREGEVDSDAIERYESEESRLEEMRKQFSDLDLASKTLERTIRRLKEISRDRFIETFEFVKGKFSELIPRLFGGGAGHLELINPEDPLTSGVELSVRPPGKRLTSMDLLSGGEKALVAAAVLMSMFLYRASPICVLDEVDAPLDDANLDRFIALIQEISSQTQFLLITHNKQTMAAVDRLIGITMEERGVSKALTVSLEQAEEALEKWAVNA